MTFLWLYKDAFLALVTSVLWQVTMLPCDSDGEAKLKDMADLKLVVVVGGTKTP